MLDYHDRTALITGGSSGIGFGLAQALVERGARVALIGTNPAKLDMAVARLEALSGRGGAIGIVLDVTDSPGWPAAVDVARDTLGPIDLLILNAGAQGARRPMEDIPEDEWRWVWDVNVNGIYNGIRAVLPAMKKRGMPGHILITASIASLMQRPLVSAYGPAKAAALAIGETLRLELANSAIGVSVLCPAGVRSSMAETMARHAPGADADTFAYMNSVITSGLDPLAVGRFTVEQMAAGQFYIFTHPEFAVRIVPREQAIMAAFAAQAASGASLAETASA